MKTLFTFFLSCLFAISAFADYGQTVIVQFTGNSRGNGNGNNGIGNKTFEVLIDGRNYPLDNVYDNSNNRNDGYRKHNNNTNSITLNNLQTGQHSIVVYRVRNDNRRQGSIYTNNQAAYSSAFTVKQGYDLNIAIKGNGEVAYIERPVNNGRRSDGRDRDRRGNNDNGNGGYNNRYPNNQNNMPAMSDAAFNQVLQSVRSKWFQSSKVSVLRDVFNSTGNYFSTYQTKQLLTLITSETIRLELAKASYRNVVDKSYFSQLYDLFSNQANRDELDRYIRSYRY